MPDESSPPTRHRSTERRILWATAVFGAVLAIAAGYLALARVGGSLHSLSYDFPFLFNSRRGCEDIRIVYLDEFNGEVLDRRSQAALLDKLGDAGARAVIYDLIFDLPSEDPEVDREFAAAILRFRGVDAEWNPIDGQPQRHVVLACGREEIRQTGAIGERLIPPNDELIVAADDFGLVALVHDKKTFTVRELNTGTRDEPSMTWKAAGLLGAPLDEPERLQPRWLRFLGQPFVEPPAPGIPALGAADVLLDPDPALFRDKVVVVGAKPGIVGEAAGVDLFATPFHRFDLRGELPLTSGVVLQATALSNLVNGDWITRTAARTETWLVVLAGLVAGIGFSRLRPLAGIVVAIGTVVLLAAAGTYSLQSMGVWFPWSVVALLQVPVAYVWGTGSRFYVERFFRVKLGEEQRQLREAFAKYVSPQMLDLLTEQGFQIKTGGEKVEAAVIFTDLANFTTMCERVGDPERIVATLNDYFERTTAHIFEQDGVVIKFIGDAILAVWGAPLPEPEAAPKAARAAWELARQATLEIEGVRIGTRIGLHFGELVAGNIGSARRVDYTLIGDTVNLAARLESLNKILGTGILMSDELRRRIGDEFLVRRIGRFKVKGRKEATILHELLGPASPEGPPPWVDAYHQALEALEADDPATATARLEEVASLRGSADGPSAFLFRQLEAGAIQSGGVIEMTEK